MKFNKNELILSLIGVFVFVLLVGGATYAYFSVNTINNFDTQTINATSDSIGSVALTKKGNGLNLSLPAPDMMQQANNVTYCASSTGTKTTPNTETIGTATITGIGYYTCNYTLSVTNANASSENNMYNAFQNWKTNGFNDGNGITVPASDATEGQIILTIDGIDYDFYTSNLFTITHYGHTQRISSTSPGYIKASLKVVNKNNIKQNAIAGTSINIEIQVTDFNCTAVEEPDSLQIIAKSPTGLSATPLNDLYGNMYRYQGDYNTVTNNYVCFGTTDKNTCVNEPSTYMYRILGIAEDGTMKLIKNAALSTTRTWNSISAEADCTGDACEWPNSTLYNGINGTYYLNTLGNGWAEKILNVDWKYGDITTNSDYAEAASYTNESTFTKKINAKIGLMYMYDYYYANNWDGTQNYGTEESQIRYGNDGWIHRSHTDNNTPNDYEWLLSRYGLVSNDFYNAWLVYPNGLVFYYRLFSSLSVRPVFYLRNNVSISNVNDTNVGSLENPYMIES